jgi:hypothetical protein
MASVMLDTPSVIVSKMEVPFPSFSLSMLFTSLPCVHVSVTMSLGRGQWTRHQKLCKSKDPLPSLSEPSHPPPVIWQTQLGG